MAAVVHLVWYYN